MTTTLDETQTLAEIETDRLTAIMFARTATIEVVSNHIKSVTEVAVKERRETALLEYIPAPQDVNTATVRWLLAEGSNLKSLYREVEGNLFARYILDRRALAIIGLKYPVLQEAVWSLVETDYRPNKWPPICLTEGYRPFTSDKLDLTDESNQCHFLNSAYQRQTDVRLLMNIHAKASKKHKKRIKAQCFLAVADAFPEFAEEARTRARKLDSRLRESNNTEAFPSQMLI